MTVVARRVSGPARSPPSCGCVARRHARKAQAAVLRITGELAGIAESTMPVMPGRCCATPAVACASRPARRRGQLHRAVNDLDTLLQRTGRVVAQTRSRLARVMPDSAQPDRVSFHDVDARPIRKGRLGRPVEFGYKAQVVDNDDGVVLDYTVEEGNPRRRPAIRPGDQTHHRPCRSSAHAVTADRGYGVGPGRSRTARARRPKRCHTPQKVNPAPPAERSNTAKHSATRSNGEPDAKAASTTSNAATAGTAPS